MRWLVADLKAIIIALLQMVAYGGGCLVLVYLFGRFMYWLNYGRSKEIW